MATVTGTTAGATSAGACPKLAAVAEDAADAESMHMCTKPLLQFPFCNGSSMRANACVCGAAAPHPSPGAAACPSAAPAARDDPTNCATFRDALQNNNAPIATVATCVPLFGGAKPVCVESGEASACENAEEGVERDADVPMRGVRGDRNTNWGINVPPMGR